MNQTKIRGWQIKNVKMPELYNAVHGDNSYKTVNTRPKKHNKCTNYCIKYNIIDSMKGGTCAKF
jgi:hypothetical protein